LKATKKRLATTVTRSTVATRRNAVAVTDNDQQFTGIQLRDAAKEMLKLWCMEKLRTDVHHCPAQHRWHRLRFGDRRRKGYLGCWQQRPRDLW
jgi:hypothetical protein